MKKILFISVLSLAVALSVGLTADNSDAKNLNLKVQSCFPLKLPGLGTTINYFADSVNTASGDTIKVKVYEPGKLVPAFEILNAVSTGKINAGFATSTYWAGKMPAAPLFGSMPFGPEYLEYASWFYYGNGLKLYQEMYDRAGFNVKVFLLGVLGPEAAGWYSKPIEKPEDIKGLRLRFMGLGGKVMQKLGASVSLLSLGETFPALEKGALDGTEVSIPSIDKGLGLYKIVKYNYFPGWHQPATAMELLINKNVWGKMTDAQRTLIEVASRAATLDCMVLIESQQGKIIRENQELRGVKNRYYNQDMLALYKKTWEQVVAEEVAKDEYFKQVWEDLQNFREENKLWYSYGYLPRPKPPEEVK